MGWRMLYHRVSTGGVHQSARTHIVLQTMACLDASVPDVLWFGESRLGAVNVGLGIAQVGLRNTWRQLAGYFQANLCE